MNINITSKDVGDYSNSGLVIDGLAFCAGEWTSNDLWINNFEYEPLEPYNFNYEADLLNNTSTIEKYLNICNILKMNPAINSNYTDELQPGAFTALNYPEHWDELLEAYTDKLKNDRTDGISSEYNKQLQKELEYHEKELYDQWLKGDRDYEGVIRLISKKFTGDRDTGSYDQKNDIYTFNYDDQEARDIYSDYTDEPFTSEGFKKKLLDDIYRSGNMRSNKEKEESERRKAEREKEKLYKEKRLEAEKQARIELLKSYISK